MNEYQNPTKEAGSYTVVKTSPCPNLETCCCHQIHKLLFGLFLHILTLLREHQSPQTCFVDYKLQPFTVFPTDLNADITTAPSGTPNYRAVLSSCHLCPHNEPFQGILDLFLLH